VDDLPTLYGDDFRVLSSREQREYNEKVMANILRDAGLMTHARLVSLDMAQVQRIVQVLKDYKTIDKQDVEEEDRHPKAFTISRMENKDVGKMVFAFIAETQDANSESHGLAKDVQKLQKVSKAAKVVEEKGRSPYLKKKDMKVQLKRAILQENVKGDRPHATQTMLDKAVKDLLEKVEKRRESKPKRTNRFLLEEEDLKEDVVARLAPVPNQKVDQSKRPGYKSKKVEDAVGWHDRDMSGKQSYKKAVEHTKTRARARKMQRRPWNKKPNLDKRYF